MMTPENVNVIGPEESPNLAWLSPRFTVERRGLPRVLGPVVSKAGDLLASSLRPGFLHSRKVKLHA